MTLAAAHANRRLESTVRPPQSNPPTQNLLINIGIIRKDTQYKRIHNKKGEQNNGAAKDMPTRWQG